MKRICLYSLALLLATTVAFAHAGEVHTYLGTITKVHQDGSFVMKMTNGQSRTVLVAKSTTYSQAGGEKAKRADVVVGRRVSAKISKDGKTAISVKINTSKKATAPVVVPFSR